MWNEFIEKESNKEYFKELKKFVDNEYSTKKIYPPKDKMYNAFDLCPYENVKVVILGQDPYHQEGQANGLSFSVNKGVKIPPSLMNIFKELKNDLGCEIPTHGDLSQWAEQGVFLLNTLLTVEDSHPMSHNHKGWEEFTDNVIRELNKHEKPLVFILWGSNARTKKSLIDSRHLIIESNHPSPLSAYRGFFGSRPFSRCNEFLIENYITPINWQIRG